MRGVAVSLATAALLVSACGSEFADEPRMSATSDHATPRITADGPHEVGLDVPPGVYTAEGVACDGFTASTAVYDLEGDHSDPDAFLRGSVRVGDLVRIVLRNGEFFYSFQCPGGWELENPARPVTPDPATLAGGCEILLGGDRLAEEALAVRENPGQMSERVDLLQDRLFAVVVARNKVLGDPAGQLVDYLDDPAAYRVGDHLSAKISRALTDIREACEKD